MANSACSWAARLSRPVGTRARRSEGHQEPVRPFADGADLVRQAAPPAEETSVTAPGTTSRHLRIRADRVEVAVAKEPLPRLQIVGSGEQALPFLYDIAGGRARHSPARRYHAMTSCGGM